MPHFRTRNFFVKNKKVDCRVLILFPESGGREHIFFWRDGRYGSSIEGPPVSPYKFLLKHIIVITSNKNRKLRVSIVKDLKMPYTRALRFCNFPRLGAETYPTHLDPIWKKLMYLYLISFTNAAPMYCHEYCTILNIYCHSVFVNEPCSFSNPFFPGETLQPKTVVDLNRARKFTIYQVNKMKGNRNADHRQSKT